MFCDVASDYGYRIVNACGENGLVRCLKCRMTVLTEWKWAMAERPDPSGQRSVDEIEFFEGTRGKERCRKRSGNIVISKVL
jgi:ferredoxin